MTLTLVVVAMGLLLNWSGVPPGQTGYIIVPLTSNTSQIRPLADATGYYAHQSNSLSTTLGPQWRGYCFQAWAFNSTQGPYSKSNVVCDTPGQIPREPKQLKIS